MNFKAWQRGWGAKERGEAAEVAQAPGGGTGGDDSLFQTHGKTSSKTLEYEEMLDLSG